MDRLELKHLAPYLPYKLMVSYDRVGTIIQELTVSPEKNKSVDIDQALRMCFLPLLRPMSDLTKEITHNGETFIPLHRILEAYCFDLSKMDEEYILSFKESLIEVDMSYKTAQMLHEMHFDTEKLIERG
ncbi:hypothetical protein HZP35_18750, partial [Elizabethkingia anophelis]|nr:hypothetical protein [Elizabethkingia anophelis]MCT4171302.1 hypothetical protein [Elizabethkingia anophelis]MCT4245717.1 hypothetical protein [Elizabethkingia anophelis]MCT4249405.1 hypothetical protein [Elizabethkingia anophelis]MCT4260441.1 hypothetical protein [Elizabethkingia anophelis]